jgi:hypothetical protein
VDVLVTPRLGQRELVPVLQHPGRLWREALAVDEHAVRTAQVEYGRAPEGRLAAPLDERVRVTCEAGQKSRCATHTEGRAYVHPVELDVAWALHGAAEEVAVFVLMELDVRKPIVFDRRVHGRPDFGLIARRLWCDHVDYEDHEVCGGGDRYAAMANGAIVRPNASGLQLL